MIKMHTVTVQVLVHCLHSSSVCFPNLTVYISGSKLVSRIPNRAISLRGKANKMSDESRGLNPDLILTRGATGATTASERVAFPKASCAAPLLQCLHVCAMKTCHYSIFAWVLSRCSHTIVPALFLLNWFYKSQDGMLNVWLSLQFST